MNSRAINPNSQPLTRLIFDYIMSSPQQRITFADYMNLVLYHPDYGYYSSGAVNIGSQGDFFTAAALSEDFGELLAEQFVEMWNILGHPELFTVVEMGAGSGALAVNILTYLDKFHQDVFSRLDYIIVEKSKGLIERQKQCLSKLFENSKIHWKSWEEIADESIVGCVFSNELVDALPIHRVVIKEEQLQEIYVTVLKDQFRESIGEVSTPKLADYFKLININFPSDSYRDSYQTEVNLSAFNWLETVAKKMQRGYLLTIDYGYEAHLYYHPQRYQGTLKCYYQHRHHHNPYINLGHQDITAHVDFTALERYGDLLALKKLGFTQQAMFLMALGLGKRLTNLANGQFDFQETLKRRDTLQQLIDPMGLGKFGVLLQAKGLSQQESSILLKGFNLPRFYRD